MWILITIGALGVSSVIWRQWRSLLRQLPDRAEDLVLF